MGQWPCWQHAAKSGRLSRSPPKDKVLRIQQGPEDVLQFRPAVAGGFEAREEAALFLLRRRARERAQKKLFDNLPIGLAGGQEPADAIFFFRQQLIDRRPADHLKRLAHVTFARSLGVGCQEPRRFAENLEELVQLIGAPLTLAFRP